MSVCCHLVSGLVFRIFTAEVKIVIYRMNIITILLELLFVELNNWQYLQHVILIPVVLCFAECSEVNKLAFTHWAR